jgi:uncharacterized damage-inducible protein DinB
MASSAVQAKQSWQQAQKCRKHLLKQLERFKDENSSGTNLSNFEAIDKTLEQYVV